MRRSRPTNVFKVYLFLALVPVNMILYQYLSSGETEKDDTPATTHETIEAERARVKNNLASLRDEIDEVKDALRNRIYEVSPAEQAPIREANARLLTERSRINRVITDVDDADNRSWNHVKEGVSSTIKEIKDIVQNIDDTVETE